MSSMYPPPQQPAQPNIDVGTIFSIGWKHFNRQMSVWLIASAIFLGVMIAYSLLVSVVMIAAAASASTTATGATYVSSGLGAFSSLLILLSSILSTIFIFIFTINSYRNAVHAVQGGEITVGDFFKVAGIGKSVAVGLVVGIIYLVGMMACVIPGIVLSFILSFAPISVWVNPHLSIGGVLSDSFETFKRNPGIAIVIVLLTHVVGGLVASTIVGVLLVLPLTYLILTITYFMINQRPFAIPQ